MSKKIILASTIIALIVSLPAMAQPPTTMNVNWNQAGAISIGVVSSDDFTSNFNMFSSNQVTGNYALTDLENNPYTYGIDNVTAQVEASVAGGGFMDFVNTRTDSWVSMYGPAGQISHTYIETTDTAQLQFQTGGNYAALVSSNYGWHSNDHFQASGTFLVQHELTDHSGEWAGMQNYGTGTTDIDFMTEATWGSPGGGFDFGKGGGCYTNCDITATGSGTFELAAIAENQISAAILPFNIVGDGTLGSALMNVSVTYGTGFNCADFSLDLF